MVFKFKIQAENREVERVQGGGIYLSLVERLCTICRRPMQDSFVPVHMSLDNLWGIICPDTDDPAYPLFFQTRPS